MSEAGDSLGAHTSGSTEPVVVFRSSDPIECGSIASALSEAGVQAWLHDDPASLTGPGLEWLEISVGRPSCVSVPACMRQHAISVITGLRPRAYPSKELPEPPPFWWTSQQAIQGFGFRASTVGRVAAWLAVAASVLGIIISLVRLWQGRAF
jgi:hypothetical protein